MKKFLIILTSLLIAGEITSCFAQAQWPERLKDIDGIDFIVLEFSPEKCKAKANNVRGRNLARRCKGVAGYDLLITDSPVNTSVTVITPSGKKYALHYWDTASPEFIELFSFAAWRVAKKGKHQIPIALTLHVDVKDDNQLGKIGYDIISKITPDIICIVDRLKDSPTSAGESVRIADESWNMPCLKN